MSNITPVSPPSSISLPTNTNVGLKQVSGVFGWMDEKIDSLINPRVIILILVVIFMGYFVINALAGGDNENDNKESALFANISILEIFFCILTISSATLTANE